MAGRDIRLSPIKTSQPQTGCEPTENAQRWISPYDDDGLQPNVTVYLARPAYIRICVHSANEINEVGGALVGQWCSEEGTGRQFVAVKHVLPARYTRQGSVYLTFTQDTLVDMHGQIDKRFEGERIVGWYHTHPRMGVFLSHYDTWLHSNFFPEPWQVALVVEPYTSLGGFFIRQADGRLDPTRYFGFYELDGLPGRSVVHWQNLQRAESETQGG